MKQSQAIVSTWIYATDANTGNISSETERLGLKLQSCCFLRPVKERCCTVKDIR